MARSLGDRLAPVAQAMRQRAFADDLQPRGGPAPREPLGREPNVIEGEFEHRDK